jgi:hypothetical protein
MDAGATQVGIFSKQVWVLPGERRQVGERQRRNGFHLPGLAGFIGPLPWSRP